MNEGFADFYIRHTLAVGFGCAVACIGKRMFWTHTAEEDEHDFVKACIITAGWPVLVPIALLTTADELLNGASWSISVSRTTYKKV